MGGQRTGSDPTTWTTIPTLWSGQKTSCMYHAITLQFVASCTIDSSRMSVDSRLRHMLEIAINTPFFDRGDFPPVVQNGSSTIVLQNPWINGTKAAPFDQRKLPPYLLFGSQGF